MPDLPTTPTRSRSRGLCRRFLKCGLYFCLAAVVLNPDLRLALRQVRRAFHPEPLIQTNYASLGIINRRIDRLAAENPGLSEPRIVERFVLENVRYVSDYDNWGNLEYWPSADEVWNRAQEDCDGRAILATSILRSRGYLSARLKVSLDHMWVEVDANEKYPDYPPRTIALLDPGDYLDLELEERTTAGHLLRLAKALLNPAAFRDTSLYFLAGIPPVRKAILIVALLALCCHPCSDRKTWLVVLLLGLASANLLALCTPEQLRPGPGAAGAALLLLGLVGALWMPRRSPRIRSSAS